MELVPSATEDLRMYRTLVNWRSLVILAFGGLLVAAAGLGVWAVAWAQGPNPQPISVGFASGSYTVGEADGSVTVTVTLSGTSSGTVTVDYATSNGTATAASDYTSSSGTLVFAPGETTKTIVVTVLIDCECEANETFNLVLSNPTGASLGTISTALITILDDNAACP